MDSSPSFDAGWFLYIKNESEGPSLDFKRDWQGMLLDESKKSNLIRHLIAFGNVLSRSDDYTAKVRTLCDELKSFS